MRSDWRSAACVAAALALLPLASGCDVSKLRVELPGYVNGTVDGLWLWRLDAPTGQYVRTARIALGPPTTTANGETISYVQQCVSGETGGVIATPLTHLSTDPNTVEFSISHFRCDGVVGANKATAYNVDGESALSEASVIF